MTHALVICRHGYRSPNTTTPPTPIEVGPDITPKHVTLPSYGATFAENLLNHTLSHTLPGVVDKVLSLSFPQRGKVEGKTRKTSNIKTMKHLQTRTYADSAVSRCQQTAVAWASHLNAKTTCGVPTKPDEPVDPRVNQTAAEATLDQQRWTSDQQIVGSQLRPCAQAQWSRLLYLLGFERKAQSTLSATSTPTPIVGAQRALIFLGLPPNTFVFATAVIMAFGLPGKTVFELLDHAGWPRARTCNGHQLYRAASRLLATILAVRYPAGYVADTVSTAVSRLALHYLRDNCPNRSLLASVCTHEEHMHFLRTALGLGGSSYARPASALLFVLCDATQTMRVYELHNRISRCGKVQRRVNVERLKDVSLMQFQRLAAQSILQAPPFICASTFGHGCPV